jgi:putative endonuclease
VVEGNGLASPRLVRLGRKNFLYFYMFYVYIIKSKINNWKYIGFCEDLRKRFKEHNCGKVKSTHAYKPFELVYYEAFKSEKDAIIEEKFLKSGKGRERLKYVLRNSLKESG